MSRRFYWRRYVPGLLAIKRSMLAVPRLSEEWALEKRRREKENRERQRREERLKRRVRHQFTFRHTPQDARSPRRTKCTARASCMSEDVPKSKLMADPDDYRAIDYPVFCSPAETPVTVERIRLMYSAFFSSAISSWFIRTSRRARTWAMDRAST